MVDKIQYRWDFIGLSTDTKPTPETNDRVANGSTFYCSDNSKLYVWYKDQWYEKTVSGGGGTSYVAGNGINISGNTISVDNTTVQEKLTAGSGITIADNIISATGGESGGAKVLTTDDYNWPVDNPDGVALWLLDSGMYTVNDYSLNTYDRNNHSLSHYLYNNFIVVNGKNGLNVDASYIYGFNHDATSINKDVLDYWITRRDTGASYVNSGKILTSRFVVDNLSSTSGTDVLSANQGRVLNQKFGGMQLVSITQTDYDALTDKDPNTLYVINGA